MSGISAVRFSGDRAANRSQLMYGDGDAWPVVQPWYPSVAALLKAANAAVSGNLRDSSNPCALVEAFDSGGDPSRMIRQHFGALFLSAADGPFTFTERLFALRPHEFEPLADGVVTVGVAAHFLGEVEYTFPAEPGDFGAALGSATGQVVPSAVAFTPSPTGGSMLKVVTGDEVEVSDPGTPSGGVKGLAMYSLFDVGPFTGLLRVFRHAGGAGQYGWYALPQRGEWR